MKKQPTAVRFCVLIIVILTSYSSPVLAAPTAELSMTITDWQQVDDAVEFDLEINVGMPSEPYASVDFNIVSSNEKQLHIADLSENGDKSKLSIEFTSDYAGVYHKGRINEDDGSVSYLVGLFSQSSGNNITDKTSVGSVKFRYSGDLAQELSLCNLKLVYKNKDGEITGASSNAIVSMQVSPDMFTAIADIPDRSGEIAINLPNSEIPFSDSGPLVKTLPAKAILAIIAATILVLVIIIYQIKLKSVKKARYTDPRQK